MELFEYKSFEARYEAKLKNDEYAAMAPMDALELFALISSRGGVEDSEKLFYRILGLRRHFPKLFLPPDLSLLVANAVLKMGATGVQVISWEMLPAAILLKGRGIAVSLPENAGENTKALLQAQQNPGIILGWDIDKSLRESSKWDTGLMERLKTGALFVSPRDFLNSAKADFFRKRLLEEKLVKSVLQLPKPRRQNWNVYPALMELGQGSEEIRIGKIYSAGSGPGGYNQKACIEAMFDRAEILPVEIALREKKIASPDRASGGVPLRKLAEVFNCQFRRSRIKPEEVTGLEKSASWLVAREVAYGDVDPLTGFIEGDAGALSVISATDVSEDSRDFLRENDILMVFRGAERTLGKCGLYLGGNGLALPNRAFCVIRAKHGISPIWLYDAVSGPEFIDAVKTAGSGTDTLIVSMEAIRDIELKEPSDSEIEECEEAHKLVLGKSRQIEELKKEISGIKRRRNKADDTDDAWMTQGPETASSAHSLI